MALLENRSYLEAFFCRVPGASRRQVRRLVEIANGSASDHPAQCLRRQAARARDDMVRTGDLVELQLDCQPPSPDWNGRLCQCSKCDAPAVLSNSPESRQLLVQHWRKHSGGDACPVYVRPNRELEFTEAVRRERSEGITARLHLTSVYLHKLAASDQRLDSWKLLASVRFTDRSDEIASPSASYMDGGVETLVVVPVPNYWSGEDATRAYFQSLTEDMVARAAVEIWWPRDNSVSWPCDSKDG